MGFSDLRLLRLCAVRTKQKEWTEDWAKAFSDGRITNPEYIDAGTSSSRNSMAKAQTRAVRFPEAHGMGIATDWQARFDM